MDGIRVGQARTKRAGYEPKNIPNLPPARNSAICYDADAKVFNASEWLEESYMHSREVQKSLDGASKTART